MNSPAANENMNIREAIAVLDEHVLDPSSGLPDEVFYYISRHTPLVNVELLIKDENNRTLLSWRNDRLCGQGWHIPGGIVRFKETLAKRIEKVAETEIGAPVTYDPAPVTIEEIILHDREIRGHFISFLYRCHLSGSFVPPNTDLSRYGAGFLKWHTSCPDDLLVFQDVYRTYI